MYGSSLKMDTLLLKAMRMLLQFKSINLQSEISDELPREDIQKGRHR